MIFPSRCATCFSDVVMFRAAVPCPQVLPFLNPVAIDPDPNLRLRMLTRTVG